MMRDKGDGARSKLRHFFDGLPAGTKFSAQQAARVAGIQEFARRLRELRAEEGYLIDSYREDKSLRADEYIYRGKGEPVRPKDRQTAAQNRQRLREQRWCELCGRTEGDAHPMHASRKVKLMVRSTYDDAVLCSYCTEGLSDISGIPAFGGVEILEAQIRRLGVRDRERVFDSLARWAIDDLVEGPSQQVLLFET